MSRKKASFPSDYKGQTLPSDDDSFGSSSSLNSLDAGMKGEKGEAMATPTSGDKKAANYRSSVLVYLAVLCAHMSSVSMGCTFGWSAPALESMDQWSESPYKPKEGSSEGTWLASILTLGALLGAMVCGICMDVFGRKKTLIGLGLPYGIGWALMGLSSSFWPILIGRMVTGISIGITTAVLPTYIAEIATPNNRGLLGMSFNFFVVFGVVFLDVIYLVGFQWRALSLWGLLPAGLLSFTMLFMPESPSWCVNKISDSREGIEAALASLKRLRSPDSDVKGELNDLIEGANRMGASKNSKLAFSLKTLSRRDVFLPLIIGGFLLFFQQFCGINAVQFYLNEIFKKSSSFLSPKMSTLCANIAMLLATIVGGAIIDRFGRRILYAFSALGLMGSIVALGTYQFIHRDDIVANTTTIAHEVSKAAAEASSNSSVLPIIFITIFVSAFSLGVGPICWVIITEITPPQTIGLISSTSSAFAWIFTFLVVNYTGNLIGVIHEYGAYWFFGSMSLLSTLFIYFLPETKGKTMEQIVQIFHYDT